MSGQVYLNPSRLSILSIPRDKVWIFSSAILGLLHLESQETPQSSFYIDTNNESESDNPSELDTDCSDDSTQYDSEDYGKLARSSLSELSISKRTVLAKSSSQTDNSSKCENSVSSTENLGELGTEVDRSDADSVESDEDHRFFHIAYTPSECTVIYTTHTSSHLFVNPLKLCEDLGYSDVVLLESSFLNLQVDSEGEFNNPARILELTRPLSQHKISLFFLSTHFTNIVLIPYDLKDQVIKILSDKDFIFSDVSNSYILGGNSSSIESETLKSEPDLVGTSQNSYTMKTLASAHIMPRIHRKVKLILTGARPGEVKQSILKASQLIAADNVPEYFAITRSSFSEISLILPGSSRQRASMGFDFRSIIGTVSDIITPITVDLSKLPIDSTGIVAGLASSLWESSKLITEPASGRFDMNYLSMARSAVILIPKENLDFVKQMVRDMRSDLKP